MSKLWIAQLVLLLAAAFACDEGRATLPEGEGLEMDSVGPGAEAQPAERETEAPMGSGEEQAEFEGDEALPEAQGDEPFADAEEAEQQDTDSDFDSDSDSDSDGSGRLPCAQDGVSVCRDRFGGDEVCLVGYCDSSPGEACRPGGCPANLACANNLSAMCDGCPNDTACLVPDLCAHVSTPGWDCITNQAEVDSAPLPRDDAPARGAADPGAPSSEGGSAE